MKISKKRIQEIIKEELIGAVYKMNNPKPKSNNLKEEKVIKSNYDIKSKIRVKDIIDENLISEVDNILNYKK